MKALKSTLCAIAVLYLSVGVILGMHGCLDATFYEKHLAEAKCERRRNLDLVVPTKSLGCWIGFRLSWFNEEIE